MGLVPARFGPGVVGGAEAALGEIAHGLAARGWEVEVLTTCARDHFTWANEFPAGVEHDGGVTVRRFPAVVSTSRRERAALNAAIVARQPIDIDAQVLGAEPLSADESFVIADLTDDEWEAFARALHQ